MAQEPRTLMEAVRLSSDPGVPLEYQLVDLLSPNGIGDEENQAIWTLVRFLGARKKYA